MPKNDNPHKDHRIRVRKEFLENGFSDATPPHKILELLLFYSIPRRDTNEIAHALLDRFGSVSAVLEASPQELMRVDGIGENSAVLIKLLLPIFRSYRISQPENHKAPETLNRVCDFIIAKYMGFTKEVFAVTTFNIRGEIIAFDTINSGDIGYVGLSVKALVEKVLERKATGVIISHNHPQGRAFPSKDDVLMTRRVSTILNSMNIKLFDHIIVSNEDDDCVSMAQTPEYISIFE